MDAHTGHSLKRGVFIFTIERAFTSQLEVNAPNGILKANFRFRFTKKSYLGRHLPINRRRKLEKNS